MGPLKRFNVWYDSLLHNGKASLRFLIFICLIAPCYIGMASSIEYCLHWLLLLMMFLAMRMWHFHVPYPTEKNKDEETM